MKQQDADAGKQALAEYLWLSYFNRTLRDKGLITQQEYRTLQAQFHQRKQLPKQQLSRSYEMEM